jgi:hypothetical protein
VVKHYVYRMDHDTGFAPHVSRAVCTLCGCKTATVESWAEPGSWVIGIGGIGTNRPDKVIYAMQVKDNPTVAAFRRQSPRRGAYLAGQKGSARVLVARHYYYLGMRAVSLPSRLKHLLIRFQGCKRVAEKDALQVDAYLAKRVGRPGAHGSPNNGSPAPNRTCGCGRHKT